MKIECKVVAFSNKEFPELIIRLPSYVIDKITIPLNEVSVELPDEVQ